MFYLVHKHNKVVGHFDLRINNKLIKKNINLITYDSTVIRDYLSYVTTYITKFILKKIEAVVILKKIGHLGKKVEKYKTMNRKH